MSTHLGTKKYLKFTRFWGGEERGTCLQINETSGFDRDSLHPHIQLTYDQCQSLHDFLHEYLSGRAIPVDKE